MLKNLRRKAVMVCVGVVSVVGILPPAAQVSAMEGPLLLKMGWSYAMAFPDVAQVSGDLASGLAHGINTYRVVQYGGDQWYLLQIVAKKPGGGWFVPQGAPCFWVNMNYALWVQEAMR